jgi:phosphoribosyl 1,2-cyclic phosphate phosphodiesterase
MSLIFTILGCGSSAGVPRPGLGWGDCDPANPKNRRRRCSLLAERRGPHGVTRVLIDTAPDLREQLLDAGVDDLDAVLFTHEHADQTHGLDDLRPIALHRRARIPVYLTDAAARDIRVRFAYCFETPAGSHYPPILVDNRIETGHSFAVEGKGGAMRIHAFAVAHGETGAAGFRIGGLAYTPDISDVPPESLAALENLDVWIIDGLRYAPHPSHFSIEIALDWVRRMRPRRAILTNLSADVDYDEVRRRLPAHVEPAFDGMVVTLADTV